MSSGLRRGTSAPVRPGPLTCSPPLKNGRRRKGTSNMRLETASHSLVLLRLKRSRASLLTLFHIPTPVYHASSSEEMARSTRIQSVLSSHDRLTFPDSAEEQGGLNLRFLLNHSKQFRVGHRVPPRSAKGKACALPRSASGTPHEVGWPRNWF
jgi:hypothetical protein